MSHRRNIEPLGTSEAIRSPMLAEAMALMSTMPADYLAAMLPILATYVPEKDPRRTQGKERPRGLTIHWARKS